MHHRHRRSEHGRSREEIILRRARRRANAKLSFVVHLLSWGMTVLFLSAVSFRAGLIVALAWGIGLALHGFGVLFAPELRDRFIDRELRRRGYPRRDLDDDDPEDYPREVIEELARLERAAD